MNDKPSVNQLNYAHNLAEQLNIEDRYNWLEMTREEVYKVNDVIYGYCYKNSNMKDRVRKE